MPFPRGSEVVRSSHDPWAQDRETRFSWVPGEAVAPAPAHAFDVAFPRVLEHAHLAPGSVVVVAVGDRGEIASAVIAPGAGLTIGRHSLCRLRLPDDGISLRQLTCANASGPNGPLLRVWDLHTGRPFATEDGAAAQAVVADGPLYLRLGGCALWLLPTAGPSPGRAWPPSAADAWAALPSRHIVSRLAEGTSAALLPGRAVEAPARSPWEAGGTRVTRVLGTAALGELAVEAGAVASLEVELDGVRKRYAVGAEHLERGVLIGRYDRCGTVIGDNDRVSRVHLLIASVGAEVWAMDTASTNGTELDGALIEAARLSERAVLWVADVVVRWRYRVGAA
jgi:hypothetical protein